MSLCLFEEQKRKFSDALQLKAPPMLRLQCWRAHHEEHKNADQQNITDSCSFIAAITLIRLTTFLSTTENEEMPFRRASKTTYLPMSWMGSNTLVKRVLIYLETRIRHAPVLPAGV